MTLAKGAPRAHGPHRTGRRPAGAHLVPEVLPSRLGMVLDMTLRDIERAVFRSIRRLRSGMTPLNRAQLLTEDDYLAKVEEYGDDFQALMGAEGIRELRVTSTSTAIEKLRGELETTGSEAKNKKFAKRLKVLEGFQKSGIKPTG